MAIKPRFSTSIDINAPPERVYEVMIDVERWHEWTPSISSVRLEGPFEVGTRALVRQPKLPPATWAVSKIETAHGFEWISKAPGLKVTGHHFVERTPTGSRATLGLSYEGIFGGLLARMTEGITRRYIAMEAEGLKARAENPSYRQTHGDAKARRNPF